jgi:hypothetical protein
MPPHEERFAPPVRSSIVWTPSFSAFSIGMSGMSLFRSGTHVRTVPAFGVRQEPWALCIGPSCPGRVLKAADSGGDPGAAAKAGSTRLITDIGPVAVKALGLFSTPVPSREHPVAMRVSPMFACGGGGLEMRAAWW